MVGETSRTLLHRIRKSPDDERWSELVALYSPFIRSIVIGCGVKGPDADDVVQNALTIVFRRIGGFDRQRTGSFRAWLRAITVNSLREYWRSKRAAESGAKGSLEMLQELEDPNSELTEFWNQEHNRHVLAHLLGRIKAEFRPTTYQAFQLLAVQHKSVDETAHELGITANAAFIARSRVMKRLKEIGAEILE